MNLRSKSSITSALAVILLVTAFVCGCTDSGPAPAGTKTISVTGSTTVLPLAQIAAEAYMDTHPDADIQVSGGGSSVGVKAVGEGTAEIGMASRDLKSSESETYPDLVEHVVAKDAIAIIVHPSNSVTDLSIQQIKSIYLVRPPAGMPSAARMRPSSLSAGTVPPVPVNISTMRS
ncbi:substrate-binding domain-containing protein [Methanogenium cariaci]|uniref:substrate-binding domain-containing protein n=1 Tax=Methanogenium cariaci TaxID=2197 RepID=UPI0024818D83|nr:substrate-binding domain-containing protein [Methanogenium cariaci]